MSPGPQAASYAVVRLADRFVYWQSDTFDRSLIDSVPEVDVLLRGLREPKAAAPEGDVAISAKVMTPDSGAAEFFVTAHPFSLEGVEVALLVVSAIGDTAGIKSISRDDLTGLADRGALEERLARHIQAGNSEESVALLFVDLDGFKEVNDSHGHLVGDEVLATIGQRLGALVREGDFVGRFGGDEFVILIEGAHDREQLEPLVARLRHAIERPIETSEGMAKVGASVGIAVSTEGFASPRAWLAAADKRMYDDKRGGAS